MTRDRLRLVRFCNDDPAGVWKRGDAAQYLGPRFGDTDVLLLRLLRTGETLALSDPFRRGLVEDAQATKGKGS